MKYKIVPLTSEILSHRVIVRMLYISLFVPHFVCISDVDQLVGWQVWLLSRDLTVLPFTLLTSSSLDEARRCPCHPQPPLNNSLTSLVIFLCLPVVFVNFFIRPCYQYEMVSMKLPISPPAFLIFKSDLTCEKFVLLETNHIHKV